MKLPFILSALYLPSLLSAASGGLACPDGSSETSTRQGNTLVLSCVDAANRPHGPFEVWAYPDTLFNGKATLIVKGNFEHGVRTHAWTTYSKDGSIVSQVEPDTESPKEAENGKQ